MKGPKSSVFQIILPLHVIIVVSKILPTYNLLLFYIGAEIYKIEPLELCKL